MKLPHIKTSLPGPKAAALIHIDRNHVSPPTPGGILLLLKRLKGYGSMIRTAIHFWISHQGLPYVLQDTVTPMSSMPSKNRRTSYCTCQGPIFTIPHRLL